MVNSDYTGLALAACGLEYEGSMCLSAHVAALGNYRIVFIPLFLFMLACVIVSMKAIGLQRPASIVSADPVNLLRPRWGGVDSLCALSLVFSGSI